MENLFEKEPMPLNDKVLNHEDRTLDVPNESASSCIKRKAEETSHFEKKRKGLFTEEAIPEELTHMGDNVFVGPSIYKGKVTVHIREYAKYGKAYYPTRRGVNFEPWCLNVLATNMTVEEPDLLTLNLELPKNFVVTYKDSHFTLKQLSAQGDEKSSLSITTTQWEELMSNFSRISDIVTNLVYQNMNFCEAYESVSDEPVREENLPQSFDISMGRARLQTILKTSLEELLNQQDELKYPQLKDCEELVHKTETVNAIALRFNAVDIARQFYGSIWGEEPYLMLVKPAHYITKDFLKSVCLNHVLDEVRNTFCTTNGVLGIEYYEYL
ncbi:uncharacterized protein LOC118183272 [Stegodyphus dumicola]|uniref:uncharacterized protein LOC118183272 n=1 Tax=Stegodyphus dumicola TaxID=202533 RepID=UPI0015AA6B04|nr:uncharacterized protein LOC118183272 [Stegodyphus dumicola]